MSTDPIHPERVYVVYHGLTSPAGTNIDLFIARSLNGQASAMTFLPQNTIHITDAMLRLAGDCPSGVCPSETDEWLPSIIVDDLGGINIMYLYSKLPDSSVDPEGPAFFSEVRYARWSSDAQLAAGAAPFVSSFGYSRFWTSVGGAGHDYHMVKASGCYVYAAYSRGAPATSDPWRTYFRRVLVGPCRADMNRNGIISSEDFDVFVDEFIGATEAADMDGDEEVTSADLDVFADAYCEGCTVPQ